MFRVFAYTRLHSLSPPTGIQEQEAESGTVFDLAGNFRDLKKLVDYAMKHDKTQICMVRLYQGLPPVRTYCILPSLPHARCVAAESIYFSAITTMYNHDV